MKFMKEQEHEILKLETGELVLKPYAGALGEIMLYNGSFRIAIHPKTWERMKTIIVELIDGEIIDKASKEIFNEN